MTSSFSTILLIGGTSGIGEALARRFHALGKHLIITGRRADRLAALASSLPGTSTYELDITDFPSLAPKIATIIADHPDINTVFLNAGIQKSFSFLDSASITPDAIQEEINTNLTAPVLPTRLLLPHLLKVSEKDKPATLIYTSSGLAFMPLGIYPVYCATKAAIHSLAVSVRQQLTQENVHVIELVPPYVDTALDAGHREAVNSALGGKVPKPMPLDEYVEVTMGQLEGGVGGMRGLAPEGSAAMRVKAWRDGLGKMMERMGIDA